MIHRQGAFLVSSARTLAGGTGDNAASAVPAVINSTALEYAVFGHPVGAAFTASNIVAIDPGLPPRIPTGSG